MGWIYLLFPNKSLESTARSSHHFQGTCIDFAIVIWDYFIIRTFKHSNIWTVPTEMAMSPHLCVWCIGLWATVNDHIYAWTKWLDCVYKYPQYYFDLNDDWRIGAPSLFIARYGLCCHKFSVILCYLFWIYERAYVIIAIWKCQFHLLSASELLPVEIRSSISNGIYLVGESKNSKISNEKLRSSFWQIVNVSIIGETIVPNVFPLDLLQITSH